ncbi:DUF1488 family protein [Paraburkholderia diazotrophica]|uniref:DUF1488 domain-containing protein n=1 Tax=Paraburkholderia diazotrophica TaxID=667676 RepID=A0A1H7DIQ7_9BURK|nr:DUF1488 family protein [Paraburkholderia diazotrophica]SEK01244.1 Protein of unknown function [Paraburkholderia diazotrophica]
MEQSVRNFALSTNGQSVTFDIVVQRRAIGCAITRDALEQHFWLERGADELHLTKAFGNGQRRIAAVAERKALAKGATQVLITADDFEYR